MTLEGPTPRPFCLACHKPEVTCVCSSVPRVENRTGVLILQHPRERFHALGTARLARLGLARARVHIAWNAGQKEDAPPPWLPPNTGLLYPGPSARDLSSLESARRPEHLLVLDGTWHTAKTLYRDKRWLHELPHYRLYPEEPSRYRIRREPHVEYLSSIEAIVTALSLLEPETPGLDELLRAFDAMIDAQIRMMRSLQKVPRPRKRRPEQLRQLPRALSEHYDRLVVVYGESARESAGGPRILVHLCAVSLRDGEMFERFLKPQPCLLPEAHLRHMQLEPRDFDQAVSVEDFRRHWADFLRRRTPAPIVAAWNQSTLDLLSKAAGVATSHTALKAAYRRIRGAGSGSLDEVASAEGLCPEPLPCRGRAALRLSRAVAMARKLRELPAEDVANAERVSA